jgi:hypothetical protein
MSKPFHLLDLISQGLAVQQLLRGYSHEEKVAWLAAHGRIEERKLTRAVAQRVYEFESHVGRSCIFFIDGDEFVFFGDHTTFTVGPETA